MVNTNLPDINETDLERVDLVDAANQLGVRDYEELDDQELLEELGRQLGAVDDATSVTADREPRDLTRDELRDELRRLELPTSGTKDELAQRLEGARVGAVDRAQQDGAGSGEQSAEDEEYRLEDDPRDGVLRVLDLELAPVALDLLGLEVHLNRVHAVVTANPEPRYALLGKLVAVVATATNRLGVDTALGKATDRIEAITDVLPTPDVEDESSSEEDESSSEERRGLLNRAGSAASAARRGGAKLVSSAKEAITGTS